MANNSKGYYYVWSRSPLLPAWLTAPWPSFGLPLPEPRSVRAGVNSRVTASFTSPISAPCPCPGLAPGEAGRSPRGARRAVPTRAFLGSRGGRPHIMGTGCERRPPAPSAAGAASRDPQPRERADGQQSADGSGPQRRQQGLTRPSPSRPSRISCGWAGPLGWATAGPVINTSMGRGP